MSTSYRLLQVVLVLFAAAALLLYPLARVWPAGWARSASEQACTTAPDDHGAPGCCEAAGRPQADARGAAGDEDGAVFPSALVNISQPFEHHTACCEGEHGSGSGHPDESGQGRNHGESDT